MFQNNNVQSFNASNPRPVILRHNPSINSTNDIDLRYQIQPQQQQIFQPQQVFKPSTQHIIIRDQNFQAVTTNTETPKPKVDQTDNESIVSELIPPSIDADERNPNKLLSGFYPFYDKVSLYWL